MSEENVEIVRAIYAAWEQGDFTSVKWADPEIEFVSPEKRESRGLAAMSTMWREWLETWDGFATLAEEFIETGSQVLVVTRFRGEGTRGGAPAAEFPGAALFALRAGKVVRLALFSNIAEAREAAGLTP